MAMQILEAVFQNGAFRPVRPVVDSFCEGQQVRLVIEVEEGSVLDLAGHVYDGLTREEVGQIEQIAFDRRDFFGQATP